MNSDDSPFISHYIVKGLLRVGTRRRVWEVCGTQSNQSWIISPKMTEGHCQKQRWLLMREK